MAERKRGEKRREKEDRAPGREKLMKKGGEIVMRKGGRGE